MKSSIQLRVAEIRDAPFLHRLFNDPAIADYWFMEPYQTLEQTEGNFKNQQGRSRFFIITNEAQDQIGFVAFYAIDQRHRHAEFAIALDPAHQGKGYARAATGLALDYGFLTLNLRKIYLIVATVNEHAAQLYKKMGFQEEGVLKEHYFFGGAYHDAITMGLFQRDYQPSSSS